ncbi:RNA-directed DNA polymerase, eukaryota, reverse transcriptase zinc-binding domain protein [Tanacetum coccineum]
MLHFKVDFEKAFDSVCWNFLLNIMKQIEFSKKWRKYIKGCLNSATVSVLVNGFLTNEFKMERGLRQEDPLSPFLFIIVMEALQISILEALKSSVAAAFNCKCDSLPFVYLGLPVGKRTNIIDSWMEVFDRFQKRLSAWKARSLSIGGRLTLTTTVLGNLPTYYLSIFRAPIWVIKAIYGPDGGLQCDASSRLKRGIWFDIVKGGFDVARLGIPFRNSFLKIVSSGDDDWKSAPRGRSIDELTSLLDQLRGFSLSTDSRDGGSGPVFGWNSWVPKKTNVFGWRIARDRIPHLSNHDNKGVNVPSVLYGGTKLSTPELRIDLRSKARTIILSFKLLIFFGFLIVAPALALMGRTGS